MNSISSEMLFCNDTLDFSIDDNRHRIVYATFKPHRQANRDDHTVREWNDLFEDRPRHSLNTRRLKCVFTSISRNTQFWQADDRNSLVAGYFNRRNNSVPVAIPIQRRLIEHRSTNMNKLHRKHRGSKESSADHLTIECEAARSFPLTVSLALQDRYSPRVPLRRT